MVFYSAVTFVIYWPAFLRPASTMLNPLGRNFDGDSNLLVWILAWVAHALWNSPSAIFDGNILHPAPTVLAHSEHLFGSQVLFGPIYAVTGNPVLAMQGTVLLTVAACGASMFALLRHWQVSRLAALFGGFVYAFFPMRYMNAFRLHYSAGQYLPLAILFLDRTLLRARVGWALLFALALLLQMLCSFYLAYMALVVVAAYGLAAMVMRSGVTARGVVLAAGGVLIAGLGMLGTALPYLALADRGGLPEHGSARLILASTHWWKSYLYPPIATRTWGWKYFGLPYYVGIIPLTLALVAVSDIRRRERLRIVGPVLVATVAAYLLAIGPAAGGWKSTGLPYDWASRWVPGFATIRVPGRFAFGVLFGVAAAAGLGCDRLLAWVRRRGMPGGVSGFAVVLLALLVALEFGIFHFRLTTREVPSGTTVPPVYRALAAAPPGGVLEIPADARTSPVQMQRESVYTMLSVYYWKPLLNGYTGYTPRTYGLVMQVVRALPDARASRLLARYAGLRYVVVHRKWVPAYARRRWDHPAGMQMVGEYGDDRLFVVPKSPRDGLLRAIAVADERDATLEGTPLVPLPVEECDSRLTLQGAHERILETGSFAVSRLGTPLGLLIENLSPYRWPVLTLAPANVVTVAYRWEDGKGKVVGRGGLQPLPYDLAPGQRARTTLRVHGPRRPGNMDLVVGLQQGGRWFPDVLRIPGARVVGR